MRGPQTSMPLKAVVPLLSQCCPSFCDLPQLHSISMRRWTEHPRIKTLVCAKLCAKGSHTGLLPFKLHKSRARGPHPKVLRRVQSHPARMGGQAEAPGPGQPDPPLHTSCWVSYSVPWRRLRVQWGWGWKSVCFSQPCICCAASTWLTVCPRLCLPGRWVGQGGVAGKSSAASGLPASLPNREGLHRPQARKHHALQSTVPTPGGPGLASAGPVTALLGLACLACQGSSGSGSWMVSKEQESSPGPLCQGPSPGCGGEGWHQWDFCVARGRGAHGPSQEHPARHLCRLLSWGCHAFHAANPPPPPGVPPSEERAYFGSTNPCPVLIPFQINQAQ